jgi:uncharacterized protein YacL
MLDALIVITFILAGAGTGFHGIDLLPLQLIEQISTPGLRWVALGFGSFLGLIMGLLVQNAYRRLEVKGAIAVGGNSAQPRGWLGGWTCWWQT